MVLPAGLTFLSTLTQAAAGPAPSTTPAAVAAAPAAGAAPTGEDRPQAEDADAEDTRDERTRRVTSCLLRLTLGGGLALDGAAAAAARKAGASSAPTSWRTC